ncbi:hypothetical protein [Parvibaculum sp. MBR-TMA-1.3b-4.2]|jgi:hypothetical protein
MPYLQEPQLFADVSFVGSEATPHAELASGFQASCYLDDSSSNSVAICRLIFEGKPIQVGETRRVGLVFAPAEAAELLRTAKHLQLRLGAITIAQVKA